MCRSGNPPNLSALQIGEPNCPERVADAISARTMPLRDNLVRLRVDACQGKLRLRGPCRSTAKGNLAPMSRNSRMNGREQPARLGVDSGNSSVALVQHPDRPRTVGEKPWLRSDRGGTCNLICCRIHAHEGIAGVRTDPDYARGKQGI